MKQPVTLTFVKRNLNTLKKYLRPDEKIDVLSLAVLIRRILEKRNEEIFYELYPYRTILLELTYLACKKIIEIIPESESFKIIPLVPHKLGHDISCREEILSRNIFPEITLKKFRKILADRPVKPKLIEYSQAFLTLDSLIEKARVLDFFGDLERRSILVLGDDDLLSILLAMLSPESNIQVLEIDRDIIAYIEKIKKEEKLFNLKVESHDLRFPLPSKFLKKFEVFVTDPEHLPACLILFFSRGTDALNPVKGRAGYLSFPLLNESGSLDSRGRKLLLKKIEEMGFQLSFYAPCVRYEFPDRKALSHTLGAITRASNAKNAHQALEKISSMLDKLALLMDNPRAMDFSFAPAVLARFKLVGVTRPAVTGEWNSYLEKKFGPLYSCFPFEKEREFLTGLFRPWKEKED